MTLAQTVRQHEGALLALVGAGVAGIVVVGKISSANATAAAAAAAPAIPADVLPVSGAGGGGGGPSGSVGAAAATSSTPAPASTPAITGSPALGTSGGLATSAGGDYQAPIGGTPGTSSQVPGSAGGSSTPTLGQYGNTVPIAIAPSVVETPAQTSSLQGITDFWRSQIAPLLSGQGTPATRFGTVINDAGPTASLTGAEFALTTLGPLATPAQVAQAAKQVAATGASSGPGTTPGNYAGNASTLADRANNILNAIAAKQAPAAAVPVLTAEVTALQNARIAQTEAAYGAGNSVPIAGIVATWAPTDRAAYNAAHGTHY